jgi:O-antigen/teichoic acid export membrane protein
MTREQSIARRVATGTVANVAGQAVVLVTLIAVAPIIVHSVGATRYGTWVVIGSVASFGFLAELGIGAALVKYVAEHAARGEVDEAEQMVAAATWLYALLGTGVAIAGLLVAAVLPVLFDLHGVGGRVAQPLAALVALDVGISVPALAPLAVLRGLQRFPAVNAITAAGAVAGLILTIVALALGTGIVGVAAVGALNSLLTYLASLTAVRRLAPGYMGFTLRPDGARLRRLIRFSRSIAAVQVAVRLQSRLDSVVIAIALPIRVVTPYSFAQRLASGTGIATDQFARLLLPLATEVGETRGRTALGSLYLTTTRLTLAIAVGVGLPVALLGGPILHLWVGSSYSHYGGVVALLGAAAVVDLLAYPAAAVLQSIERHAPIARMALASGVANLALSIALVGPLGVYGVAAATLIVGSVEILLFVVPYALRVLDVPLRAVSEDVLRAVALPGVVLAGLVLAASALVEVNSLPRLALVLCIALAGYVVTYAAFGAAAYERDAYRAAAAGTRRVAGQLRRRNAGS